MLNSLFEPNVEFKCWVRSKAQTHTSESRYANVLFFVNSFETVSSVKVILLLQLPDQTLHMTIIQSNCIALWGDKTNYVGTWTEGYNTKVEVKHCWTLVITKDTWAWMTISPRTAYSHFKTCISYQCISYKQSTKTDGYKKVEIMITNVTKFSNNAQVDS